MPDRSADAIALCLDLPPLRDRLGAQIELIEEGPTLHTLLEELAELICSLVEEPARDPVALGACLDAVEDLLGLHDPEVAEMTLCCLGSARTAEGALAQGRR